MFINANIGDALSNCLTEILRIYYEQRKTYSEKFKFMTDVRICTKVELTKEFKSTAFTKRTYIAAILI